MRKNAIIFISLAVLSFGLLGCPPKEGGGTSTSAGGGGDILVGEYGSLTGPQATFGQSTHNGIMMAVDEINAAGGINGRKIKVLTEDDQSKQEEAANAVTKLISQNNVVAVLGEVASSASIAAAPICQSNKVPMITPSSTNDEVTQKGDYIFRICFTDNYQGEYHGRLRRQWCTRTASRRTRPCSPTSRATTRRASAKVFDGDVHRARRQDRRHAELRERRQRLPLAAHGRSRPPTRRSSSSPATTPTSARSPSRRATSASPRRSSAATAGSRRS